MLSLDERAFFDARPLALPLYEALLARVTARVGIVRVRAGKTQLSLYGRHMFACVSFLCARAADAKNARLTLTFGLPYRLSSPRVAAAVPVRPGRWTHHVPLDDIGRIDDELLMWLAEAYAFADRKR